MSKGAMHGAPRPDVLFGGVVGFLVLTAVVAVIPLTADTFSVLVWITMGGYALAILGMIVVAVGIFR